MNRPSPAQALTTLDQSSSNGDAAPLRVTAASSRVWPLEEYTLRLHTRSILTRSSMPSKGSKDRDNTGTSKINVVRQWYKPRWRELRETIKEWNKDQMQKFMVQREICWHLNPPTASHKGGVWECMIRTIRRVLNALILEQILEDCTLATFKCSAEAIVNNRPLTTVSVDHKDPEPLTANHLLLLRAGPSFPPGKFVKQDMYCRTRWRRVQYLADIFWRRWTKEYSPSLQQRQNWIQQQLNER